MRGKRGRPRRRPDVVLGDRGYDHDKYRRLVWDLGVKPVIARRGTEHGSGLGHPTLGRGARVRPPALVPPPADPLGDPRRHPRSLPHPRMRTHLLAATARSAERVRELVGRRESSEDFDGSETPSDETGSAPVDADQESLAGGSRQVAVAPGIQRHGFNP